MANWCSECAREPYVGCDYECPIFGKHLDEVAEDYFKLQAEVERLKAEHVKHGRWVFEDVDYVCSRCHEDAPIGAVTGVQQKTPFCPNCGAKMEEDNDEQ